MTPEEALAEFVTGFPEEEIPESCYRRAREGIFDCAGVMIAGSAEEVGKRILDVVRMQMMQRTDATSTVVGLASKFSAYAAALANGTCAHALDFDDMGAFGHPSAILLPATLAVGEAVGASGRDVVTAYIIGFEIGAHLHAGSEYVQSERLFHSTAVFGLMAATAAVARLLGLNRAQTITALGTAASGGAGILQNFGTFTKPLHAGLVASHAVLACLLSQVGWRATESFLGSRAGWAAAYIREGNYDPERMVQSLGRKWLLPEKLTIKKYPCCGSTHSALDSVLALCREEGLRYEAIKEVRVQGLPANSYVLLYPEPTHGFQGKFSLRYVVASAILDGEVTIETFSEDRLHRPEIQEAMRKVRIELLSKWERKEEALPAETPVEIELYDGRVLRRSTNRFTMHGTASDPLTEKELKQKFRLCAGRRFGPEHVEEALLSWWDLTQAAEVRSVAATLQPREEGLEVPMEVRGWAGARRSSGTS